MAIYKSTYGATYLPPVSTCFARLPPPETAFKQWRPPRQFPIIPLGPHRPLSCDMPLGPGLGTRELNTTSHLDPKDIVGTIPPHETETDLRKIIVCMRALRRLPELPVLTGHAGRTRRFYPHDMYDMVEGLNPDALRWITTSGELCEHIPNPGIQMEPPVKTWEKKADQVTLRPRRYETSANTWQRVGTQWDKSQYRPHIDTIRAGKVDGSSPRNPCSRTNRSPEPDRNKEVEEKILNLIKTDKLVSSFVRPCPGYAGFKPRLPIEGTPETHETLRDHIKTLMKHSYKSYESEDFVKTIHPHLGPMSRVVTLTYPYNPFNKVEKEELSILAMKERPAKPRWVL